MCVCVCVYVCECVMYLYDVLGVERSKRDGSLDQSDGLLKDKRIFP